jgi:hypothetical protein
MRAREREAMREELRSDYENFKRVSAANDERREAQRIRMLEHWRGVQRVAAFERFEKMNGWNGDRIEEFIN